MIIYKAATISDVLGEYPWFGDEDEMADEYKRLTTEYLPKQVDGFSKKYGRAIMNEVQKIAENKDLSSTSLLKSYRQYEQKKTAKM